ncbi:nickel-dependent lactate racemase [Geothermobacter ehrlichii]|uniref:Nickel-dependent lactate racemase n=1 Tax=Geothermobacter ehrlichii TaxID=213224 RepID=A0A5D3WH78_9BACT|nr:nickel-dependent lactate racemase [Geothermobacter ehrlichii]TYO96661.1 nickel-dependent lactate racemase [Geothermobacter ehrlichii]
MTEFELKYGTDTITASIPGAELLCARPFVAPAAEATLICSALDAPIGTPPIETIVRPHETVAIVTSDITRYTGSEIYLPQLVERLNRAGITDDAITIVIALGIHRRQTEAEHRKILGPLFGRIRIVDHDCDDSEQLVELGEVDGIPVVINRTVVEADRVIVTGTIGVHYFAGFGGGRKGLVPGVAARETCMATHFRVFNPPGVGGKHPLAAPAILDGNPVHAAILEAARLVEPDFLLNTVLTADKRIAGVFCGDLEQAHLAGCELALRLYTAPVTEPADLAVISCGGAPKDINFIQAHKALDYGVRALRPGGTAILLAACPDGFGHPTFFDWFRYQDLAEFETALRAGYQINGQTAHATLDKARRFRIILISGFSAEQTAAMGMEKAENLDAALQMAYQELPENPRTLVIPEGGTVLPILQEPGFRIQESE